MTTTTTRKAAPRKTAPKKPSEVIDDQIDNDETESEALAGLPALIPAHRFRARHRINFQNLQLNALKSGAFEGNGALEFDMSTPEGIEQYQALMEFVATIDEWAETIAIDPDAYAEWAEGKNYNTFIALFVKYQRELGESQRSEN